MKKRKFARTREGEVSLPELLDRLELALTEVPPRMSDCRVLSDLNRRLGSTNEKAAAWAGRITPSRRRCQCAVESLPRK
ncbi:hypothetical protein [Paraburkholderia sp. SECH2]|uniref:hypothetical protein n=1 Tax=Paraburkholderia sp. SECH2 TaxID=2937436 RepID=UPI00265A4D8C|nr:hypothetical protein [Paraburkholderia sp. SECH2]